MNLPDIIQAVLSLGIRPDHWRFDVCLIVSRGVALAAVVVIGLQPLVVILAGLAALGGIAIGWRWDNPS